MGQNIWLSRLAASVGIYGSEPGFDARLILLGAIYRQCLHEQSILGPLPPSLFYELYLISQTPPLPPIANVIYEWPLISVIMQGPLASPCLMRLPGINWFFFCPLVMKVLLGLSPQTLAVSGLDLDNKLYPSATLDLEYNFCVPAGYAQKPEEEIHYYVPPVTHQK